MENPKTAPWQISDAILGNRELPGEEPATGGELEGQVLQSHIFDTFGGRVTSQTPLPARGARGSKRAG